MGHRSETINSQISVSRGAPTARLPYGVVLELFLASASARFPAAFAFFVSAWMVWLLKSGRIFLIAAPSDRWLLPIISVLRAASEIFRFSETCLAATYWP